MFKSNKKYNPEDYKDAEFITIGDGPFRIQIARAHLRTMADYWFVMKHLCQINSEAGLTKTLAEEATDNK